MRRAEAARLMRVKSVPVPATATSLATLLGKQVRHTGAVGLQAPEANTNTVLFGDVNSQPLELRPKANTGLKVTNFQEVFVRGTPPDLLSVVLFDGK